MMKNLFVTVSAVPLSMAKPYVKAFNRTRYANIFNKYGSGKGKNKNRIYIPIGQGLKVEKAKVPQIIEQELYSLGYEVENYYSGIAKQISGKRSMRIGKLLKSEEAKKAFAHDPLRSAHKVGAGGLIAVISQHPYDIAGMSFDRGWTSCMNLKDGENKSYLEKDIEHGTLVAYLVKNNDKNINAPIARILLKPFSNANGYTILVPDRTYGAASPKFRAVVAKFCDWANSGSPAGLYELPDELYYDGGNRIEVFGDVGPIEIAKSDWPKCLPKTNNMELVKKFIDAGIITYVCRNRNVTQEILEYAFPKFLKASRKMQQEYVSCVKAPEKLKLELMKSNNSLAEQYEGQVQLKETADLLLENNTIFVRHLSREMLAYCLARTVKEDRLDQFCELAKPANHRKFWKSDLGLIKLKEIPGLKEFIVRHELEDTCFEFFMFDADAYQMFFELSRLPKEDKVYSVLNESNLSRDDLSRYVKMIDIDMRNILDMSEEVFFAIYKGKGTHDEYAEVALSNYRTLTVETLKICFRYVDRDTALGLVRNGSDEVVRYLAENINEKTFWAMLNEYAHPEILEVLKKMPLTSRRYAAKRHMSEELAEALQYDPDPRIRELCKIELTAINELAEIDE